MNPELLDPTRYDRLFERDGSTYKDPSPSAAAKRAAAMFSREAARTIAAAA